MAATEARRVWARRLGTWKPAGAVALAGLAAAGCADVARVTSLAPPPLDRTSPVAAQVEAASHKSYRTPSFRDAPPAPTDIRPAAAYKPLVAENTQARDKLTAFVAANPPMIPVGGQNTEAFAATERARIPADETAAPPPDSSAGTEEYAARLRALATPPPQSR